MKLVIHLENSLQIYRYFDGTNNTFTSNSDYPFAYTHGIFRIKMQLIGMAGLANDSVLVFRDMEEKVSTVLYMPIDQYIFMMTSDHVKLGNVIIEKNTITGLFFFVKYPLAPTVKDLWLHYYCGTKEEFEKYIPEYTITAGERKVDFSL